jgi:hypothetical protein
MTEIHPSNLYKSVTINGDKDSFNSKTAINNFKKAVKSNTNFDLEELTKKFIKPGYKIVLISTNYINYTFNIEIDNSTNQMNKRRELIKAKINNMKKNRTNSNYYKAKNNSNVSDEILCEYKKLLKVSKIPVPEPSEILDNPDQYKTIISMVLGNNMMKNMPQSHPYIKYFKLLAKEIGVEESLPFPTKDFINDKTTHIPSNLEQIINMSGPVTDIKGNVMSKDEDTDSEEEFVQL